MHGNIDGKPGPLTISAADTAAIIIDTMNGFLHVTSNLVDGEPVTQISLYDHFELTITGKRKKMPLVVLDSDEYPTKLVVIETEKRWLCGCVDDDVPPHKILFGRVSTQGES